jgi:hypothetical protein
MEAAQLASHRLVSNATTAKLVARCTADTAEHVIVIAKDSRVHATRFAADCTVLVGTPVPGIVDTAGTEETVVNLYPQTNLAGKVRRIP